ncbi:MAG: heme lyase CcmF/NrfE family subunit [Gemmatimonadota bacterium]
MTRLIGANAILVALGLAALGLVLAPAGARRGRPDLLRGAYTAVYAMFAFVTVATLAMIYALVSHDFSVDYVAQVGSRATPLFYTIISLWGALEGSILFWAWVLALYSALAVYWHSGRPGRLIPWTAASLLAVELFFLVLLAGPADPFGLVSPAPADGPGPNPLLQNHVLMAVHPPLLYLGYVGMSVPFAFAMGALLSGEVKGDEWIMLSRRWTLSAWAFLTAAIVAGMWWSYEVLGWGGYWAWDPVENASFLPWLTATAFLHSVMVQERRGMLKLWNLNLIVGTFALTMLGTFLTRSGVLSSVHAFTTGTIGYWFLGAIGLTLVVSVALVAGNSEALRSEGRLDSAVSRETVFLLNNLFLTAFMFTVLVGTLFPLAAEAVRGVKVSVGEPFFNRMTIPLCAALLFLMGVGPALPWKSASAEVVRRQLGPPAVGALLFTLGAIVAGVSGVYGILAFAFAGFAITANLREFMTGTRARMRAHGEGMASALGRLIAGNQRRYGGYTAHLGVLVLSLGIAASSIFRTEYEQTLARGGTMTIGEGGRARTLRLEEVWGRREPQRDVLGATVTLVRDGRVDGTFDPRMNFYPTSDQPVPTPSVRSRPWGDIYVNLQAFAQDGSTATLRVIIEPFVAWIWIGGGIICIGALLSMLPLRRRLPAGSTVAVPAASRTVGSPEPAHAHSMDVVS